MPLDLSKLSDEDLQHLQKGNLQGLSDEGLAALHPSANTAKAVPDADQPNPFKTANGIEIASKTVRDKIDPKIQSQMDYLDHKYNDKIFSDDNLNQVGYNMALGGVGGTAGKIAMKAPGVALSIASKIPGIGGIAKFLKIGKALLPEAEEAAPVVEEVATKSKKFIPGLMGNKP